MEKESTEYKVTRELLASLLWASKVAGDPPWRHKSREEEREEYRAQSDLLLESLEQSGLQVSFTKKGKAVNALRELMTEPEHLSYTLEGVSL